MNSRYAVNATPDLLQFGDAGTWRHNYQWTVRSRAVPNNPDGEGVPDEYVVTYPDGRSLRFTYSAQDPFDWRAGPGIADRFRAIQAEDTENPDGNECALLLPDGGQIRFVTTFVHGTSQNNFNHKLVSIIDPYGQVTSITYPNGLNTTIRELQPAGRMLKLIYKSIQNSAEGVLNQRVLDRVEEWLSPTAQGRTVQYGYTAYIAQNGTRYTSLTSVVYFNDTNLTASYAYQPSNRTGTNGSNRPLIASCDDLMFELMAKIAYEFVPGGAYGQLSREKHPDGTPVSTLTASGNSRTETRGDGLDGNGPLRTFTYSADGLLKSWTDFKGAPASQTHLNGFVSSSTDERGNITLFERNTRTGNVEKITHPATPSENPSFQPVATRAYVASCGEDANNCDPANPYYLFRATDERNFSTFYLRDASKRVRQINYPDLSSEEFTYNTLGQVLRHRRKNGFYEHFKYDEGGRGLLITAWNPLSNPTPPTGSEAKTTFSYYLPGHAWADRVKDVTDARGNITTYEYEGSAAAPVRGRGLVSKITFPGGKFRTFSYDRRGNLKRAENELSQPVEYDYDDYSRVTKVRTARPDANNPSAQAPEPNSWAVVTFDYAPGINISPYARTTRTPTTVTTATNLVTNNAYDFNLRLLSSTRQNPGAEATTQFHYDLAGNQDSIIDPNGHTTTMGYDQRNRRMISTSPPVAVSGIADKVPLVSEWFYDPAGNVRLIKLPDGKELRKEYDEVNRIEQDFDQLNRLTTYEYYASGQIKSVLDANNHRTRFEYDARDLKKKLIYPNLAEVTGWNYDEVGNMTQRPTVGGPKQLFSFDARNRLSTMRWSNAIDFSDFTYDDASRLASARNPYSTITRQYDIAGRLIVDRQAVTATVNTPPATVQPLSVVSRKSHSGAGSFDINLSGPGIECRSGGTSQNYTIVLEFSGTVTALGGANVSSGFATVQSATPSGNDVIVNLSNVSNAQRLTVNVHGVTVGGITGEVTVAMNVLVGDVIGDGVVNSADITQTSRNSGQIATSVNFRSDMSTDGVINSADVTLVRRNSGTASPSAAAGPALDVSYSYNDDNQLTRLHVPGADYDYTHTYDPMGRLEKIYRTAVPPDPASVNPTLFATLAMPTTQSPTAPNAQPDHQYYYDKSSNVIGRMNFRNSTRDTYTPDEINRLTQRTTRAMWHQEALGTWTPYDFSQEQYGYDKMSRLKTTGRNISSGDGSVTFALDAFGYNDSGELTSAQYDPVGNTPARSVAYNLDDGGNRTSVDANGTAVYTADNLNQYSQANGLPVSHGPQHELTGYDGVAYRHLADGQLAAASRGSTDTYLLGYDALGRCVRRTTNGQALYYIHDGARAIIEHNPATSAIFARNVYGRGIDEIILRDVGTLQFFHHDRLGNTSAVTDGDGGVIEQYRYDAFGAPEFRGPPVQANPEGTLRTNNLTQISNRFLFTGREWVARHGFYEYRARAYNPALGRFMSEDPIGFAAGDTNLFRYCAGDPINRTDPFGLETKPEPEKRKDGPSGGRDFADAINAGRDAYIASGAGYGQSGGAQVWLGEPTAFSSGNGNGSGSGGGPFGHGGNYSAGSGESGSGSGSGGGGGGSGRGGPAGMPTGGGGGNGTGSGPGSGNPGAGNPGSAGGPTLGDLYDYGRLRQQLVQYGTQNQASLNSTAQFGQALYIGAGIYSAVGLGGMAAVEVGPAFAPFRVDGPGGNRIVGLRYGPLNVVRLDYHPFTPTNRTPQLHLNIGPNNTHIYIDPRTWWYRLDGNP